MKEIFTTIYKKIKFQLFETDDLIINWNNFDKGVFFLVLGVLHQGYSIIWYWHNVEIKKELRWLNIDFYSSRMTSLIFCILLFSILLIFCHYFKNNQSFRTFISYISPVLYGVTMIYSGYTVGIYSVPTISGFVCIVLVGLVFYNRKIIYGIAIPITIFTLVVCYLSSNDLIAYAPLFTEELNQTQVFKNSFWVRSMAELFLPILFVSILFFEILLSQWRRREKKIERLSTTDALTELYNRRYIGDQLNIISTHLVSVIILDLDYFKKINDSYGHDIGDTVLCRVARILESCVRASDDVVGRFGGEEFILLLPQMDLKQAQDVAEHCRAKISQELIVLKNTQYISISASFGISTSTGDLSKEELMGLADQALYLSKQKGRNCVSHYLEIV